MIIITIGTLAVLFSIATKIIGGPDQIRKIYKEKSTKQISTLYIAIGFFSHLLWVVHGILHHDNYLIIGQLLGVILMGVILFQIYIYNN